MSELLEAKDAIRDCLFRYCRGIDRADAGMLRSAYWPDAIDDHGLFTGNAYDFIDWCVPLLEAVEHSQHMLGNMLIEVRGDEARAETYYHAYERRRRRPVPPHATRPPYEMYVGGRYLDRLTRRNGDWRIQHRIVMWDWFRHFKDSADLDRGVFGAGPVRMGAKGEDDPSYALFQGG